ncbi:MAG: MFS transporter [Elusimicrobia bacterium]|nr:MFS transporter [Elusimicrobiota bacterium]
MAISRLLRAFVCLAALSWAPAAFCQQVTVAPVQVPGAPTALGQLGALIQGSFAAGQNAPGVSVAAPALLLPTPVITVAPAAMTLSGGQVIAAESRAVTPAAALSRVNADVGLAQGQAVARKLEILLQRSASNDLPSPRPLAPRSFSSGAVPEAYQADGAPERGRGRTATQAAQPEGTATQVLQRAQKELASVSAERLQSMPAEELEAWARRILEGEQSFGGYALTPALSRFAGEGEQQQGKQNSFGRLAAAARSAAMARADAEPVPAPAPEPEISPEARRTIHGFTLARIFSIAAYSLFTIAFAGMAISTVGMASFATLGVISGVMGIPLSFLNGMLVDKLSPRQILVGGSAMLTVVALITAFLKFAGLMSLATLVPLSVIAQFMLVAIMVGEGSLVPKILGGNKKAIQKTNALFDLIFAGVGAVSSLAGGFLVVSLLGQVGTFLLYAAVQGLVVIPIYLIFMPKTAAVAPKSTAGFGESFSILRKSPYLLGLLALTLAGIFLVYPLRLTLLPLIVRTFLHGSDAMIGYGNAAVFTGMLGASIFNSVWATKFKNSRLLQISALAFAAFGILLAAPGSLAALFGGVAAVFFLQTIGLNVLRSLYMTEAQQEHPEFMGRLMGISSAMYGLAISSGTYLVKSAMAGAAYPALLWWLAGPYAAALVLMLAAPYLINLWYRRTHPAGPEPV